MKRLHEQLKDVCQNLDTDFEPYGERVREGGNDCSSGCRWFKPLEGREGLDWGVCFNPESPRAGLLTFEHQGCSKFQAHDLNELLQILQETEDHAVRDQVAEILYKLEERKAVPVLVELLQDEKTQNHRLTLLWALNELLWDEQIQGFAHQEYFPTLAEVALEGPSEVTMLAVDMINSADDDVWEACMRVLFEAKEEGNENLKHIEFEEE